MNEKNNNKVSVFYGRARRIELYEKIAYVTIAIVAVAIICFLVFRDTEDGIKNVNFSYMRQYFEGKGYICERIHENGGKCYLKTDLISYDFSRYDDGFEYMVRTDSYYLYMKHSINNKSEISFKTTSEAFAGYRNEEYNCKFKDNVLGPLGECTNSQGEELNLSSYIGVIEQAQSDIENIIKSSGYSRNKLLEEFIWKKK